MIWATEGVYWRRIETLRMYSYGGLDSAQSQEKAVIP